MEGVWSFAWLRGIFHFALWELSGRFVVGFFGLCLCRGAWRGVSCLCRLVVELVLALGRVVFFFRFLGRNRKSFSLNGTIIVSQNLNFVENSVLTALSFS